MGLFSLRKAFTVSERVAIADAVAERLRGRAGNPELRSNSGNISGIESGDTRDLAAAKAGLGSGKTLEAAQKGIARGFFCFGDEVGFAECFSACFPYPETKMPTC